MNKYIKLALWIIVFIAVILASYFSYHYLSNQFKQEPNLAQIEPTAQTTEEQSAENNATATDENATEQAEDTQIAAPDFTVYDKDGNNVNLSDFIGKPVIINFWTTWCPYCIEELPYFEDAFKTSGKDIQFMMIDVTDGERETIEMGMSFISENGYTFPVYYDTSLDAANTYGIQSFPTTLFIDKEGNVAAGVQGALDQAALSKGVELIKGEDTDIPQ